MTYSPSTSTGHTLSAANSTAALLLGGATFTGAWEDVTDYTTVAVAVLGSLATDGTIYFDLSTDGGTTSTAVPATVADATFAVPRVLNVVESHVRIRYINGTTAQTGTFSIQTKYSNGQPIALLGEVDGFICSVGTPPVEESIDLCPHPCDGGLLCRSHWWCDLDVPGRRTRRWRPCGGED